MNLLSMVDKKGANKRLVPSSPQRPRSAKFQVKRNRSSSAIPDLVGEKEVDTSSDDSCSTREPIDIEQKLLRAKERRDESERNREMDINLRTAKNEEAVRRAKEKLLRKQAKLRHATFKIAKANEERSLMEEKRRNDAMATCQTKLSNAASRAKQNLKRRQIKAKHDARLEKVQTKRALLDFERKAAILATVYHRKEKATNNRLDTIQSRRYKAREEIEHAQHVAKRMKAVRILQRVARKKFGMEKSHTQSPLCSETEAVMRLQNWSIWRERVVAKRLSQSSSVKSLLTIFDHIGGDDINHDQPSFEALTAEITKANNLEYSRQFLRAFQPLLKAHGLKRKSEKFISDRVLLLAFLISAHPDEVLGDKRYSDKCSKRLEASCNSLLISIRTFAGTPSTDYNLQRRLIRNVSQNLVAFGTLFDVWKNADLMELVSQMVRNIEQSWIVYYTSKEALCYGAESGNVPGKGGPFFQHRLRHETSKREAGAHIRRVRASIIKVLGMEEGCQVLRDAKRSASRRIKDENLIGKVRSEINGIISKQEQLNASADEKKIDESSDMIQSEKWSSNIKAVHNILLIDDDDAEAIKNFTVFDGEELKDIDNAESFFDTLNGCVDVNETGVSMEVMVTKSMERAFFEQVSSSWLKKDSKTVQNLMIELCVKLRKLVPRRVDLHSLIEDSHVQSCNAPAEMFCFVQKAASILCHSLESPIRSTSTLEWIEESKSATPSDIPFSFDSMEKFVVASILFLTKKADLCALDLMKFEMLKAAPIIRQYGQEYELKAFEKTYGVSSSSSSLKSLLATWSWLSRVSFSSSEDSVGRLKSEAFVDNLLFVKDAIQMPEILYLDAKRIDTIRKVAQKSVLCSALLLRACSQVGVSPKPLSLSTEAQYCKDCVLSCLKEGSSFETLRNRVSNAVLAFAEAVSGEKLKEAQVASLKNSVSSILKGSDPVLKLMDNRVRQLFRAATSFSQDSGKVPITMRSGIIGDIGSEVNRNMSKKEIFLSELSKEAEKLGFGFVCQELLQAAYDGYKVIDLCVQLYEKRVLRPIIDEMRKPDDAKN